MYDRSYDDLNNNGRLPATQSREEFIRTDVSRLSPYQVRLIRFLHARGAVFIKEVGNPATAKSLELRGIVRIEAKVVQLKGEFMTNEFLERIEEIHGSA